ncbi:T9SS type A sorting domain-containing protein [Kordia sp.]|uniref:T9SS type A sorting domain-containing protein n=1 Tax=Kordia sp. TaxID=1965332 RepID=UPI0025C5FE4F|nr:T9SS type A sorting domain-containing protein [Kordia sp.]MCH2196930.1 T9SS type A sorting domain-containing protein [Kordia sp.]
MAIEGNGITIDYTFTPVGGSNSPDVATLISGSALVNLNWSDVTSFTVTSSSGSLFGFDNLVVNNTFATPDFSMEAINISPNPVENILFIENATDIKSINVFNKIGQLVFERKNEKLDFNNLPNGLYFLKLETETGITTKKI